MNDALPPVLFCCCCWLMWWWCVPETVFFEIRPIQRRKCKSVNFRPSNVSVLISIRSEKVYKKITKINSNFVCCDSFCWFLVESLCWVINCSFRQKKYIKKFIKKKCWLIFKTRFHVLFYHNEAAVMQIWHCLSILFFYICWYRTVKRSIHVERKVVIICISNVQKRAHPNFF